MANDIRTNLADTGGEPGSLLRFWRDLRGKSQLELSFDSGISQRHISFVESGRSVPGRQTLLNLAEALDIPLRERNALLLSAGYAPKYSEAPLDAPELRSVHRVLELMLRQHEPYPALVMDRHWNVLMTNDAAPRFFQRFVDLGAYPRPRNILRMMFDPQALRPAIANWDEAGRNLILRVHREATRGVLDPTTRTLLDELLAYPGVDPDWKVLRAATGAGALPFVPIGFTYRGRVLSYFSLVSTVGTPQTASLQELRVETMFPADPETEAWHADVMAPE